MLPQRRRFELRVVRQVAKLDREARDVDLAVEAVVDPPHRSAVSMVRVVDGLGDREHRGAGHPELLHTRDRAVDVGEALQPALDLLDQLLHVGEPTGVVSKSGIVDPLLAPHGLAQVRPVVEEGHHDDRPTRPAVDPAGSDVLDVATRPRGLVLSTAPGVARDVGVVIVVVRVEERDIEVLALPGSVAVMDRGHHGQCAVHPRADVADCRRG